MRKLLTLGLVILLVGVGLLVAGSTGGSTVSAGGVVFIGPLPIVFGTGPGEGWLALLSVVIGGIILALVFVWGWRVFAAKCGRTEGITGPHEERFK